MGGGPGANLGSFSTGVQRLGVSKLGLARHLRDQIGSVGVTLGLAWETQRVTYLLKNTTFQLFG